MLFVVCNSSLCSNPSGSTSSILLTFWLTACSPASQFVLEVDGWKVTHVTLCDFFARPTLDPRITQMSSCGTRGEIPDDLTDTWWLNWVVCQTHLHSFSPLSGYRKHTVCEIEVTECLQCVGEGLEGSWQQLMNCETVEKDFCLIIAAICRLLCFTERVRYRFWVT